MKYKKGSIVEVLITDEVPYHSWRCAQIVSGNGHNYTLRYDVYPGFTNEENVERVSRKFIRPCPPAVEISECWPGDVVEVFHDLSWKMAIVSKAIRWDLFLVRLAGSFLEFEASKSELRVRQSWQNDEWVVIGKVHMNSEDGQCRKLLKHNLNSGSREKQRDPKGDLFIKSFQFCAQNDNLQESHIVSTRTLKRGSPCCVSQDEVNEGTAQKFRLTQKEGRRLLLLVTSPERVDAVPNSREMPGEKGRYSYFDNRAAPSYAADMEREDLSGAYRCSRPLCLEPKGADSVASSTGSCGINSYRHYDMECKSGGFEDVEGHDSDAESVCQVGYQEDLSLCKKELAAEIHTLEPKVGGLYTLLLYWHGTVGHRQSEIWCITAHDQPLVLPIHCHSALSLWAVYFNFYMELTCWSFDRSLLMQLDVQSEAVCIFPFGGKFLVQVPECCHGCNFLFSFS
ncbi:Agenet-like domain-containing protein [Cynara cardunculus var. scolymus]|uniref:Agenet-like domain-containing protein n=1 Tax=Cynara cardunculus var. scolymus TaxID=59895 RepID=A0A103XN13_CYNCS|nr:Agenet-like domain-containing protein [Cynara cardunculus var. scolymus]